MGRCQAHTPTHTDTHNKMAPIDVVSLFMAPKHFIFFFFLVLLITLFAQNIMQWDILDVRVVVTHQHF